MELFHNQVTKAQGIGSLRFQHRSFGLYMIAENIEAPTTVLDFPSRRSFVRELRRGYDVVGISFIAPNFAKAREMARLVRRYAPRALIVIGGHGAAIEGVEQRIDCDYVAKGEGIRWMRAFLGEDVHRPVVHPNLVSAENKHIYGVPTPGKAGLLVTGVGCVNGCRFCATSHNFGRVYTPFLRTGREIFEAACRMADAFDTTDFFVMDENFLKDGRRARELIDEMERANRYFHFAIFSSAEAVVAFGIQDIVRLGVFWLWMGVESQRETYEKNKNVDLKRLIDELQDHGVAVLASAILFLEAHTPDNIQQDIDFVLSLSPTFTQFMQFTPMPVTALYEDFKRKGLLDFSIPFEEWHGQHRLTWRHPNFTPAQTEQWLASAFQQEFDRLGTSVMRMTRVHLRGLQRLKSLPRTACIVERQQSLHRRVSELRLLVPVMERYAHNATELELVQALGRDLEAELGPCSLREKALIASTFAFAARYAARLAWKGDRFQPPAHRTSYRQGRLLAAGKRWLQSLRIRPWIHTMLPAPR